MNCNCNDKAIVIVRGNDTNFNDGNFLTINLNTTILDLSTFKATFKLGSIIRQIDDISSGIIHLNFTAAETFRLPQFCYGTLNLVDTSNRVATIESLIPFQVISVVNGNAIATEPYTLNFDVKQGGETILNVSVESAVTVEVGQTTTLPAGSQATVTNSGTGNHLILNFGIPKGVDGGVYSVNGKVGDVVLTPSDIGAQAEITEENKLNSDLVDDADGVNKFVSAEEKAQITTNKNDIIGLDQKIDSVSGALSDSITGLDNKYDSITGALDNKIDSVNGALSDSITTLDSVVSSNYTTLDSKIDSINGALSDSITALDSVVSGNYTTLDNKIDSVNGALSDSITALDSVVSSNYNTLDGKIDSINGALSDSISAIDSTIGGYGDIVTHNVSEFATSAQGALADSAIQPNDNISELANDAQYITIQPVNTETTNRENADLALQQQIDAIVASSDVFDVVGTYADLQNYDISTVPVNDIIKVLVDSTHNDAATYYRCVENNNVKSWSYIGSEGAYYTKGEADGLFVPQTRTVNSKALSSNITLTASDVGALPSSTTIGAGVLTIQKNSTDVGTFGANDTANKTINLSIPTKLSDITVSAGSNIQINGDTISATDTTYTAGTGIDITNGVISNTLTSAEWGNITGTLSSQTDLQNALDAKQDVLTAGDGINITNGSSSVTPLVTLPLTVYENSSDKIFDDSDTAYDGAVIYGKWDSGSVIVFSGDSAALRYGYGFYYSNGIVAMARNDYQYSTLATVSGVSQQSDFYYKIQFYQNGNIDMYYSLDDDTYTLAVSTTSAAGGALYGQDIYVCGGNNSVLSECSLLVPAGSPTISCDNTIARLSDIKNATLTIQKNGSSVATFGANASSDVTCNITVPTKVSDLTDDTASYPIDKADTLTGLTATITELNYVNGVTSSIQTQLNGKLTTSDIVSSVSSSSTNSKAVGAKLFYDTCGDIETLINAL